MTRLRQGLGALAALGALTAFYAHTPFQEAIAWQRHMLNYLRGGRLRQTVDTPPHAAVGTVRTQLKEPAQPIIHADVPSGFYQAPLKVSLASSGSGPIYYTLGEGDAFRKPSRYREPIALDRTTVLSFAEDSSHFATGRVEARTYLMSEFGGLPVLSLALNPAFLWDRHAGIYRHFHKQGLAWQRPAQAEYFEEKSTPPIRFPAELKIQGGWTRNAPKKSFQLRYATARLSGADRRALLFWPEHSPSQRAVVARAAAMDVSYRLGNELFRSIYADAGGLMTRAMPIQLLLNGAAWGLYNLHEKVDHAFLARIHGAGEYDLVDDAAYRKTRHADAWNAALNFFLKHDLSEQRDFEQAKRLIDLDNFTDYWLFNIYAANVDWPQNNYYAFRKRGPAERWRWVSWDTDATFNSIKVHHDTLSWATRAELRHDLRRGMRYDDEESLISTAMIRSLLANSSYRSRFVRRFCELHLTIFDRERLRARFESILHQMTPHLQIDWQRWPGSKRAYVAGVVGVRQFIAERPAVVLEHFRKRFEFSACPR